MEQYGIMFGFRAGVVVVLARVRGVERRGVVSDAYMRTELDGAIGKFIRIFEGNGSVTGFCSPPKYAYGFCFSSYGIYLFHRLFCFMS